MAEIKTDAGATKATALSEQYQFAVQSFIFKGKLYIAEDEADNEELIAKLVEDQTDPNKGFLPGVLRLKKQTHSITKTQ